LTRPNQLGGLLNGSRISTPASFITAAEEAHPAFRYAIAVAGLFAIVVIFAKFGVSLAGFVLGAIAVIALMVVFLVFAQASKLTRAHLNLPAQVLVWAYLLMIVGGSLLVIASIFFNAPLPLRAWIGSIEVPCESSLGCVLGCHT
jgi:hypothetical protein